jgi:hypothetical protein
MIFQNFLLQYGRAEKAHQLCSCHFLVTPSALRAATRDVLNSSNFNYSTLRRILLGHDRFVVVCLALQARNKWG